MNLYHRGLLLIGISTIACSSGSDTDFDAVASSMEGIYGVSAYTRNDDACTPGGESRLRDDRFAFVARFEFFGTSLLSVTSCASVADCRNKLAMSRAGGAYAIDFGFNATSLGTDGALLGETVNSGFADHGSCTGGEVNSSTVSLAGSALHIDVTTIRANDYPVDGRGFCSSDAAARAARGNACTKLETVSAVFLEAL